MYVQYDTMVRQCRHNSDGVSEERVCCVCIIVLLLARQSILHRSVSYINSTTSTKKLNKRMKQQYIPNLFFFIFNSIRREIRGLFCLFQVWITLVSALKKNWLVKSLNTTFYELQVFESAVRTHRRDVVLVRTTYYQGTTTVVTSTTMYQSPRAMQADVSATTQQRAAAAVVVVVRSSTVVLSDILVRKRLLMALLPLIRILPLQRRHGSSFLNEPACLLVTALTTNYKGSPPFTRITRVRVPVSEFLSLFLLPQT